MKAITRVLAVLAFTGWATQAMAVPIPYDIDFTATSGTGGAGVFTVDSSALAAIPATGIYFSDSSPVLSFSAIVAGILFDTIDSGGTWAASNGQVSGITGICCTDFSSSTVAGARLRTDTGNGAPIGWSVFNAAGSTIATGDYSVSPSAALVPAPATLALFGLGLAGLSWSRRKKV